MSAYEQIENRSREEIIAVIASTGLREFGVYNYVIADKWNTLLANRKRENQPLKIVAALNNNDMKRVKLAILRENAVKVMEGMKIAAYALEAEGMELYVPESEVDLKNSLEEIATTMGIQVYNEFLNVNAVKACAVHHIETMAAISDIFCDSYSPGVYVATQENKVMGKLTKVAFGTKITDLLSIPLNDLKGIQIGSRIYDTTGLDILIEATSPIGNGVITPIPNTACMIQESEKILLENRKNGCGKCTFCREGLIQLHTMTKEIIDGKGKSEYTAMLSEIGEAMSFSTLCSVGKTGSDFVLGTLNYFPKEYDEHIKKKNCPAGICTSFVSIYINPETCEGCEECTDVCPVGCIEGKAGHIHMIEEYDCTKCGKCIEACEYGAIIKTTGRVPKLPTRLTKCGKFKKH